MATLLGSYTGTCTNVLGGTIDNSKFIVDVYYEQSIVNNTTTLTIKPRVEKTGHGESVTWYFKLDGNDYYSVFCNTYVNKTVNGGTAYKTITHNNDGSCTFTLNVSVETSYTQGANANLNNACMKWGRLSKSITLPTIPRASDFTISGNTIGSPITVAISRKVSSFTHHVYYKFGTINSCVTSGGKVGTSCTFTPALNDAVVIPNSAKGSASIVVETYNGSTLIGSKSQTFDLHTPASMRPTINQVSMIEIDPMMSSNSSNTILIANVSKLELGILSANSVYGATIKSYSIIGPGINITTSSGVTTVLPAGSSTYTFTVTDSRGRTTTETRTITAHTYIKPAISKMTAYRSDSNGTANDGGQHVVVSFQAEVQNTGSANINSGSWCADWRLPNGNWNNNWKTGTLSSYNQIVNIPATGGWDVTKSYEIRVRLIDYYSSDINAVASIGTAGCAFNIEDGGVGVGKYWEKGALDVGGTIYSDGHKVPVIKANDGVMEVGQSIDMHHGNFSNDYDTRLEVTNSRSLMIHTPNGEVSLSNADAGGAPKRFMNLYTRGSNDCAISNSLTGHYLQLLDNGWLDYTGGMQINRLGIKDMRDISPAPNSYASYQATLEFKDYASSGINTQSVHWANVLTTKGWGGDDGSHPISQLAFNGPSVYYRCSNGSNAWRGWNRLAQYKHLNGYWGMAVDLDGDATWIRTTSPGLIPHSSGGNSSSLGTQSWIFKEVHGKTFYMENSRCFWASNKTDIMTNSSILPDTNGSRCLGYTNNRWAGVYAANGTIQTSDMRYKSDIKDVDNEIFFNMIKGTGVHTYVLNENRVDAKDAKPLTEDTAPQENIHLGILAQELAEFEGSNYILNYDEESGYSINNYNLTSAVMAALKAEISKREKAEERLAQAEEHIKVLEDRLEKIEALLDLK